MRKYEFQWRVPNGEPDIRCVRLETSELQEIDRDLALVARIRARGQLTLPIEARTRLSIAEDDRLVVVVRADSLELIPIDLATRSRRWLLTGRVRARIDAAMNDVAHGRFARIRSTRQLSGAVETLLALAADHGLPDPPSPPPSDSLSDPPSPRDLCLTPSFAAAYHSLRASGKQHCIAGLHRLLNRGDRILPNLHPIPAAPGLHECRIGYNDRAIVRLEDATTTVLEIFSFSEGARANARAARWESRDPR
jgi:bifunctional DNA-binding transcriptional regulator/antitoxin component of YhaV-PrlF toxin-antitoxin module